MGGLTFEKLLLIGLIAAFIFGPERLPTLAEQLAQLIKRARGWTESAKERVSQEMGEEFTNEDWRKLDPRQYDPRRIIRDAWNEADPNAPGRPTASVAAGGANTAAAGAAVAGGTAAGGTAVGAATVAVAAAGASAPAWAANSVTAAPLEPGRAPFDSEAT